MSTSISTLPERQLHPKVVTPKMRHSCTLTNQKLKESTLHHYSARHSHLCQSSFVSKEAVSDRILNAHLPTILVDVRDEGVLGGMIQGALFCPESNLTERKMRCLLEKAKERRRECYNSGITEHKTWVVFYCMETDKRSLRCAEQFHTLVSVCGQNRYILVKLLVGGAEEWIKSYWNDKRLVEGYDDEYWGFKMVNGLQERTEIKDKATESV